MFIFKHLLWLGPFEDTMLLYCLVEEGFYLYLLCMFRITNLSSTTRFASAYTVTP